jgi:hypothetical protein
MNKQLLRLLCATFVIFTSFLITTQSEAQLKIGSNPTTINKSSILELESANQGLLLTRLTDTTAINTIMATENANSVAGTIIYLDEAPNYGLYVRTAGGYWQQLSATGQDSTYWRLTGNAGTDSTKDFLGTTDAQPVSIRANNTEAIHITRNGNLELPNLQSTTDSLQVLVIDPSNGNIIEKRNLSMAAFRDAIQMLNGLKNEGITLNADSSATNASLGFTTNATDSTISLNIPVVNGTTQTAGLLSFSDYEKFDSVAAVTWTTAFDGTTSNANGITVDNTNHVITLHAADATNPGGVTAADQTFGGNKTFNNNVVVNQNLGVTGTTALDSTLNVTGTTTFGYNVTTNGNSTTNGNTVLNGNTGSTLTISNLTDASGSDGSTVLVRNTTTGNIVQKQLDQSAFKQLQTGSAGTNVNIDSSQANSIIINVPYASTTDTGLVTLGTQSFAGSKTFTDSLTVGNTGGSQVFTVNGKAAVSDSLNVTGAVKIDSTLTLTSQPATAASGQNYVLIRDSTTGKVVQEKLDDGAFKSLVLGTDNSKGDLYIDSTSTPGEIILNVPTAAQTVRGVVNDTLQTFGGAKNFADSVTVGSTTAANSTLQVSGSFSLAINTVTTDYTATSKDNTILANTTSGPITVTLPSATGLTGRIYTIKKIGTGGINNPLTITPSGGATIDGGANDIIYNDWTYVSLQTDGTNWYIVKN